MGRRNQWKERASYLLLRAINRATRSKMGSTSPLFSGNQKRKMEILSNQRVFGRVLKTTLKIRAKPTVIVGRVEHLIQIRVPGNNFNKISHEWGDQTLDDCRIASDHMLFIYVSFIVLCDHWDNKLEVNRLIMFDTRSRMLEIHRFGWI